LGFRLEVLRFRVWGLGSRVQGSGFRVQGLGLRVPARGWVALETLLPARGEDCPACKCRVSGLGDHVVVLESQLPHKIVNSLFTITNKYNKLTILWGVDFH